MKFEDTSLAAGDTDTAVQVDIERQDKDLIEAGKKDIDPVGIRQNMAGGVDPEDSLTTAEIVLGPLLY